MNAIGITDLQHYELPGGLSNESTSYNQTEIMRILNRLTEAQDPLKVKTKKLFEKASIGCSGLSKEGRRVSYFSDEERRELMEEYKDENRRIAGEYLNREELFLSGDIFGFLNNRFFFIFIFIKFKFLQIFFLFFNCFNYSLIIFFISFISFMHRDYFHWLF